jgi:serine/threonine-protein kinase
MVLDFGVCKMDGLDAERLTGTGESIGTVAYMAPEQIRGAARVDERADLFAFGVLVFEMLSGRLPHDGPSQMAILASKLENAAARLRDCSRVAIPEGTDELVMRALARDPAGRFASAQELLKAWRGLSKGDNPMMVAGSTPPPRPSGSDMAPGADPPTEVSRPPSALLAMSASNADLDGVHDHPTHDSGENLFAPSPSSLLRGSLPPEPHPTQTSLTTHHTSIRGGPFGQKGGTRIALVLAACGLIAGIVVVGVSFTKSDVPDAPARTGVPSEVSAAPSAAEAPSSAGELAPPTAPGTTEASFELPAEPAQPHATSGAKPPKATRVRPPRPPAAPKGSGPRITSQPRY